MWQALCEEHGMKISALEELTISEAGEHDSEIDHFNIISF